MRTLDIASGQGPYTVQFHPTLESLVAAALEQRASYRIVIDRRVAELYRAPLASLLEACPLLEIEATEDNKSLAGVEQIASFLQSTGANKSSTVLAIGGGIIQDVATLAAHIYYRGTPIVLVPTTLLSMADSCIGAKCGVNFGRFKNQLGAFQSPKAVLQCAAFVETLSDKDVASGYGEILKLCVTGEASNFDLLRRSVAAGGLRNPELTELVLAALEVKRKVIEVDEYEKNLRRILNYGHTFGHALESITDHEIPHGLGVAWGMDVVHYISVRKGLVDAGYYQEVKAWIRQYLPFRLTHKVTAEDLVGAVRKDKKAGDAEIALVLTEGVGKLKIVRTPFDGELTGWLTDYLARENVYA